MTRAKRLLLAVVVLVLAPQVFAQSLSCSSAVTLNGPVVEVAGVSGDDTENVQCALREAASGGFREVFLTSSSYEIGAISVDGFTGDFKGTSAAATSVTVTDGSLSCAVGQSGVALQFNLGTVSVRNMTINVGSPCGNGATANVIAFYSDPANCSRRTTFGNVDRVTISGAGVSGSDVVSGVLMDAAPGCDPSTQKILGTLKVNRATVSGLEFGVITSIGGGGQVDINFTTFSEVGLPISIIDASQSTTILNNTISYNDVAGYGAGTGLGTTGIFVASTSASPNSNGTTIRRNNFNDGGATSEGYATLTGQSGKSITHSMVVTDNRFTGATANSSGSGLAAIDTSGGLVAGNTFTGFAGSWVDISSGDPAQGYVGSSVSGWAFVGNNFSASTATTDINLGNGTTGNVVGKSQGSPVVAGTQNNDVLESSASASFIIDDSITMGARSAFDRQLETLRGRQYRQVGQ